MQLTVKPYYNFQFEGTVKGVLNFVKFAMACKDVGFYLRASDFLLILQRFGSDEGTNINVTEFFDFIEQKEGGFPSIDAKLKNTTPLRARNRTLGQPTKLQQKVT